MAQASATTVTFLPYLGGKRDHLQRQIGLQLSTARRHIALAAHARRRKKIDSAHANTSSSKSTHTATKEGFVSHTHDADESLTRRSNDWQFGSLGPSCRPINAFDIAVLQYSVGGAPQGVHFGKYLLGSSASAVFAVFVDKSELVQHVISALPLLDSLVACMIFMKAQEEGEAAAAGNLVVQGQRALRDALRSVRQSLLSLDDEPRSLDVVHAVLLLCMAAFMEGNTAGARVHLKFLIGATNDVVSSDGPAMRTLYQIRGCDMRYALDTGCHPLSPMSWEQVCSKSGPSEHVMLFPVEQKDPIPIKRERSRPSPYPPKLERSFSLSNGICTETLDSRSRIGFLAVIEAGLLTSSMWELTYQYANALDYIARIPCTHQIALHDRIQAVMNCFACLYGLCTEWANIQQHPEVARLKTSNLSETPCGQPNGLIWRQGLDRSVLLAMQIHFAFCIGDWLSQTMPILASRLRITLENSALLTSTAAAEHPRCGTRLSFGLILWVLVMGMLASKNKPQDLQWFRYAAQNLISPLCLRSDEEIVRLLAPFTPPDAMAGDLFVEMARSLSIC